MSKENRVPKLRFPGFTDDWEQCKLDTIASFSKGSGYSKGDLKNEGTPIILYGRLYTKYETVISEVDTFAEAKEGSVYSKGGEVIVPASGETAEDISVASVVEKQGVLLGGDLNIITPRKELDPAFLALNISFGEPHKEMAKMAQGKSVVHLHNSDLAKIDFSYPSYAEQRKISGFFSNIDNLITLHQRKLKHVKEYKESLLNKMFPKKEEKYPEIRFPGFTEDWEQRKLGDITKIIDPHPSHRAPPEVIDGIPFVGIGDVDAMGNINRESARKVSEDIYEEHHKRYDLCIPSLGIGRVASLGKVIRLRDNIGKYAVSPTLSIIQIQDKVNVNYLYSCIESPVFQKQFSMQSNGSTRQSVGIQDLRELIVSLPKMLGEQEKIGQYFESLDKLITLHQRKQYQTQAARTFSAKTSQRPHN